MLSSEIVNTNILHFFSFLLNSNKTRRINGDGDGENINISKPFPITVNIHDTGEKPGQKRGVHIVEFLVNNKVVKKSKFDSISLIGQYWTNETGLKFDELYFKGNYYIDDINFRSGQNNIEVKATDFNGNESIKYFTFNVNSK